MVVVGLGSYWVSSDSVLCAGCPLLSMSVCAESVCAHRERMRVDGRRVEEVQLKQDSKSTHVFVIEMVIAVLFGFRGGRNLVVREMTSCRGLPHVRDHVLSLL